MVKGTGGEILECHLLAGVVGFTGLFLPCCVLIFSRCLKATMRRNSVPTGYQQVDVYNQDQNPLPIVYYEDQTSATEVEVDSSPRIYSNVLFLMPSLLSGVVLSVGSWFLCKYSLQY